MANIFHLPNLDKCVNQSLPTGRVILQSRVTLQSLSVGTANATMVIGTVKGRVRVRPTVASRPFYCC